MGTAFTKDTRIIWYSEKGKSGGKSLQRLLAGRGSCDPVLRKGRVHFTSRGARAHKSRMSIIYIYRRGPMSICFHPSRPRPLIPRRPDSNPFLRRRASSHRASRSFFPRLRGTPLLLPSLSFLVPSRSVPFRSIRATPVSIGQSGDLASRVYLQLYYSRWKIRNRSGRLFTSPPFFSIAPLYCVSKPGGSSLSLSLRNA